MGRQKQALTVPRGYPCTSGLSHQESQSTLLPWFPAAGSFPGLCYCSGLDF